MHSNLGHFSLEAIWSLQETLPQRRSHYRPRTFFFYEINSPVFKQQSSPGTQNQPSCQQYLTTNAKFD
eukprot:763720-Hanusia_phi.AAC.3